MTAEEIVKKFEENGVRLFVKNGKIEADGKLNEELIRFSSTLSSKKKEVIDYLTRTATPTTLEVPLESSSKINRLTVPCVYLGQPLEKADSCGCNGSMVYSCQVFGKCRRLGIYEDIAVCTLCHRYEPSQKS